MTLIGVITQIQDRTAEGTSAHNQTSDHFKDLSGLYEVRVILTIFPTH